MNILGIETSCDETGIAIYNTEKQSIISEQLFSQASKHAEYGGVVPELASRDHLIKIIPLIRLTLEEASIVKYTINTFLATKVTFFNQIYDLCQQYGANFNHVANAAGADSRIGLSHTKVPGFDGKRGFGGACFPKDCKAITDVAGESILSIVEATIKANNEYRAQYERDDREKAQNIVYLKKEKD